MNKKKEVKKTFNNYFMTQFKYVEKYIYDYIHMNVICCLFNT